MKESINKINAHFSAALPAASLCMSVIYLFTKENIFYFLSSSFLIIYCVVLFLIGLFLFFNYGSKLDVEAEISSTEIMVGSMAIILVTISGLSNFF